MSDESNNTFTPHRSPGELLNELDSLKALLDEEPENAVPYTSINEIDSVEDYLRLKQRADSAGMDIEEYLHQQADSQTSGPELELLNEEDEMEDEGDTPPLDEVYLFEEQGEDDGDALLLEMAEEETEEPSQHSAEASRVEEYFRAVAAAKHPRQKRAPAPPPFEQAAASTASDHVTAQHNEVVPTPAAEGAIPLLDEVVTTDLPPQPRHAEIPVLEDVATPEAAQDMAGPMSLGEVQELLDLMVERKLERLKPQLRQEVMEELQRLLPLSTFTTS